jgi:hypothetical protein
MKPVKKAQQLFPDKIDTLDRKIPPQTLMSNNHFKIVKKFLKDIKTLQWERIE